MAQISVGMAITMGGKNYMVERITRREETYFAYVDSETIKVNHSRKFPSMVVMKLDVDRFEVDDTVTERVEEIRLTGLETGEPLTIVNFHTWTKEVSYGEKRAQEASNQSEEQAEPAHGGGGIGS